MPKKRNPVLPADSLEFKNQTAFRILERKIKRKGPFDSKLHVSLDEAKCVNVTLFGNQVRAFEFTERFPGMFILKNAIPSIMQAEIVKEALVYWAKPPNVSNLDSHFLLNPKGVWNQYSAWKKTEFDGEEEPLIKKRVFTTKNGSVESVYDADSNLTIDSPVDSMLSDSDQPISAVINRLRWLTLGYQYNWSNKEYHFDRVPPFPVSLVEASSHIIEQTSGLINYNASLWRPEAGIVNFYQPGDTLTAHQDKSEINKISPLLSLSIGLECIFLFGTQDRSDEPIALHLESGDLIIMSGKARQSFHGVPRVMENTCPEYLLDGTLPPLISQHLKHTRININIRQVFK